MVEFYDGRHTKWRVLTGDAAAEIRHEIQSLTLTKGDIDSLRKLSISDPGSDVVILRPFDGVVYHFRYVGSGGAQEFWIDNPSFDMEHHRQLSAGSRLATVLEFLTELESLAKKEKRRTNRRRQGPQVAPSELKR